MQLRYCQAACCGSFVGSCQPRVKRNISCRTQLQLWAHTLAVTCMKTVRQQLEYDSFNVNYLLNYKSCHAKILMPKIDETLRNQHAITLTINSHQKFSCFFFLNIKALQLLNEISAKRQTVWLSLNQPWVWFVSMRECYTRKCDKTNLFLWAVLPWRPLFSCKSEE